MSSFDIVVVGGGIVGASLAYHCVARNGPSGRVLLVDREDAGNASRAGAGIVSVGGSAHDDAAIALATSAVELYPGLVAALEELAPDLATGYSRCGKLTIARTREEARTLDRISNSGILPQLERIEASEARTLFPVLGRVESAIYDPLAARVDGRGMTRALRAAAQKLGVELRKASARLRVQGRNVNEVELVDSDRMEVVDCGAVAIAGGAWSPDLARELGSSLSIAPQRGQILHFGLLNVDTAAWPVITTLGDYYLVAWPGGRVVCGATRETGAGYDPRQTASGVREVLEQAHLIAPGLDDATLLEIRVGLRPLAADGLPILGRLPGLENVFVASGHGPEGLTLGPYSGKRVADWMCGDESVDDLAAFGVERF